MPVVRLYYDDLERLTGASIERIKERLPLLGADIERETAEYMDVEFFPNRPDLFSVEGVARAMRAFLDIQTGLRTFKVGSSGVELRVDAEVLGIRPWVVCALVRNVNLSERAIESLMNLQEHLHRGIGRNRRKVSIGVHDFGKVKPPFKYTAVEPDFSFVPLDFEEEMTMRDILRRHPKGIEYAFILKDAEKYPIILDSEGKVLSFPPIINTELTRVTEETRDIFVEVTGMNENVHVALNIVACALAERGGEIQKVVVRSPLFGENGELGAIETPRLEPVQIKVRLSEVRALTGLELSAEACKRCAERMGLGVKLAGNEELDVSIPAYRYDILHPWDVIEDITIGYGYDAIQPTLPKAAVVGEEHPEERRKRKIREMMVGLGFTEVLTFTLSSEKKQFEFMRRVEGEWKRIREGVVRVADPISAELTMLRCSLLPNLLEVLARNKHHEMPQRIFEVGSVFFGDEGEEEKQMLAAVAMHAHANFAEVRSVVSAVLRELGCEEEIEPSSDPAFLKGRRADIFFGEKKAGVFGELHPEVLSNFGIDHPVVGFEINIDETLRP